LEGQVVVEERVGDDAGPTHTGPVPDERVSAYRLLGHRIVGVAADEASDGVAGGLAGAKSPRFVWTLSALPGQMARLDNAEFELLAPEVHFDQQQNLAWTMRPGTLSFLVPHDAALPHPGEVVATRPASSVGPAAAGHSQIAPAAATQPDGMPGADPGPGRGTAKWQKGFQFDGRQLLLDGQVEWQIERPKPAGLTEQIRGFGERMAIELSETVAVGTGSPSAARPTAQRIQMSSGAGPGDQGDPAPIKLYLEQRAADRSLVAHEVIWASDMQVNLPQNTFHFSGPGSLWSVRAEPPVRQPISSGPDLATELTYLKVQFQRSMDGQWVEGIVNLAGPVSALYGKATGWEILENESRLLSPLKIHSDSMSLNRWQPTPEAAFELEWEARPCVGRTVRGDGAGDQIRPNSGSVDPARRQSGAGQILADHARNHHAEPLGGSKDLVSAEK
jgi:hypothetical protein